MADIIDFKSRKTLGTVPQTATPPTTPVQREPSGGYGNLVRVEAKPGIDADDISAAMMSALVGHMTGSAGMTDRLANLISRNENKIAQYRDIVSGYSPEQIDGFLEATDAEIMRKPYFYYAIADEAKRRLALA